MSQKYEFKNSEDRLRKALEKNRGTYTISKDGYIRLDMTNQDVRDSFKRQADQVRDLMAFMKKQGSFKG